MCVFLFLFFFTCAGARGPFLPGAVSVSHSSGEGGGHGRRHQEGHPPGPAHLLLHLLLAGWGGAGGGDEEVNSQTHAKTRQQQIEKKCKNHVAPPWWQFMSFCHSRSALELVMFNLQRAPSASEVYSHERINVQAVTIFIHSLRHSLGSEKQRLGAVLPLHRREEEEKEILFLFFHTIMRKMFKDKQPWSKLFGIRSQCAKIMTAVESVLTYLA